jgi:hypothetical protein
VRRVEDITLALWGMRVSASTVSDLNQNIYKQIEDWRQQPLVGDFLHLRRCCVLSRPLHSARRKPCLLSAC